MVKKANENKPEHKGSENLIPMSERTEDEVKKMASNGGKKSGEARRQKKMLKDTIEMLLKTKPTPEMVKMYSKLFGFDPKDLQDVITGGLMRKAINGDTKAFEILRDTIGEKPTGKLEVDNKGFVITVANPDHKKLLEEL